jgi:hypothetical protein
MAPAWRAESRAAWAGGVGHDQDAGQSKSEHWQDDCGQDQRSEKGSLLPRELGEVARFQLDPHRHHQEEGDSQDQEIEEHFT